MSRTLLLALALVALPAAAQPDLGETAFPNSGAAAAQAPFLRGLLLLHSFEYDDAREAFREARRVDPDFAMAAWGEAMTHNHPIWMRQDRDAARAALGDALWADLVRDAGLAGTTPRERAYLRTLSVLFGEGDKEDRDDAYAEAMRQLAERYPDDLDARSFYALALLGTAHEGRDFTTYMQAAAVAEEVFDENPRHPGAAHYLIHAYDDPVHAPLGLRPARVYAEIAPAASHALHMPSHITLALGMWDDVAEMNQRSFEAAQAGTDRRGEPLNGHGWHALWWWHYAETQRGDAAEARRLHDLAVRLAGDAPDGTAAAHVSRIRAQHFVATGDATVLDLDAASPSVSTLAIDGLANGAARYQAGDTAGGDAQRTRLRAALDQARDPGWEPRAALYLLDALHALATGTPDAAVQAAQAAAALEAQAPLMFGPPAPVVPAHEFLGGLLLDLDRPAEAAAAFRTALERAPNRRASVEGLARAQGALGTR